VSDEPRALLVTGAYGTGKTSLVEEIADIFEHGGVRFGAIDLDWLGWFDHGSPDHAAGRSVLLRNLAAVVGNYRDAGMVRFAVAGTVTSRDDLDAIVATLAMPTWTVRLTAPIEEIERRLGTAVTAGRADDLEVARRQVASAAGEDVGDLVLASDRPVRELATEVLAWFEAQPPD